jgi:NAD(P)H-dependent flavin oxidoreductase YrpB (nitropropane dioxygenase family)
MIPVQPCMNFAQLVHHNAGSGDFTPLWSGQAARLARELPAAELTKRLAAEALEELRAH